MLNTAYIIVCRTGSCRAVLFLVPFKSSDIFVAFSPPSSLLTVSSATSHTQTMNVMGSGQRTFSLNLPTECLTESFRMDMYSTGVLKKVMLVFFSDNVEKKNSFLYPFAAT